MSALYFIFLMRRLPLCDGGSGQTNLVLLVIPCHDCGVVYGCGCGCTVLFTARLSWGRKRSRGRRGNDEGLLLACRALLGKEGGVSNWPSVLGRGERRFGGVRGSEVTAGRS